MASIVIGSGKINWRMFSVGSCLDVRISKLENNLFITFKGGIQKTHGIHVKFFE